MNSCPDDAHTWDEPRVATHADGTLYEVVGCHTCNAFTVRTLPGQPGTLSFFDRLVMLGCNPQKDTR